jgi:hypothetical protein
MKKDLLLELSGSTSSPSDKWLNLHKHRDIFVYATWRMIIKLYVPVALTYRKSPKDLLDRKLDGLQSHI